ncbi:MAG: hypothetical protein AMXMBFR84_18920 [Candidatus Hydrogenedentota bacterium]
MNDTVIRFVVGVLMGALSSASAQTPLRLEGITTTPHVVAESMRYRQQTQPARGARVQLFLVHSGDSSATPLLLDPKTPFLFGGREPSELIHTADWAWHDTPSAERSVPLSLPAGMMTVWTFNSRTDAYGPGTSISLKGGGEDSPLVDTTLAVSEPDEWISAITFTGAGDSIQPDTMVIHIANEGQTRIHIRSCRFWLPPDPKSPKILAPQEELTDLEFFNGHDTIPSRDQGGFAVRTGALPLTYAVLEVHVDREGGEAIRLWSYLRIKPERFDISGGWVNDGQNTVGQEQFLKTLMRLHINTAHLAHTPGYSDTALYARYPLKYFNKLTPFEQYDTDEMLPRIHAVEFLGEPQYGGGTPVPPQEVWRQLKPYTSTRLPTTVTHSEERIWRDYAGLSDFPHYDAYRVTAPAADLWSKYERWGDVRIRWGAPLETIGDMCRSLRELNRPMPCAIWSQGPHEWDVYGGRKRTTPTPDEIRMQAYHALSTRITSLYWFNLSLKSLTDWRDTLDELGRIGREMRLIDDFLIGGNAYRFERVKTRRGRLDWDLASVCGPTAALLFALDLNYSPSEQDKVFVFEEPRRAEWQFALPAYLPAIADVFRLDADGIHDVKWQFEHGMLTIRDTAHKAVMCVATPDPGLRQRIESERQALIKQEEQIGIDPARNDSDFEALRALLNGR